MLVWTLTVDSKQLEYGPWMICAGFASSLGFGVGGWWIVVHTISLRVQSNDYVVYVSFPY